MKYIISMITASLILFFLSCDKINNNLTEAGKISVVSTLQTGGEKQYIQVCSISNMAENGKYDSLVVKDAQVKLFGDDFVENFKFGEMSDMEGITKNYFYETTNSLKDKLLPGKTYRLYVKSGDNIINGSTTFPGDFNIVSQNNNDTIHIKDNQIICWTKGENAYLYIVYYGTWCKRTIDGETRYYPYQRELVTRDTCVKKNIFPFPGGMEMFYHEEPLYCFIKVIAMDKNYYEHTYLMRDRSGIDAGYGCFSSGVVDIVRLHFKK